MAFAVGFVFAPLRRRKRTAVPTRVGRGCEFSHTRQNSSALQVSPYHDGSMRRSRKLTVLIERDEDGYYVATAPALRGCHTQAKTLDALMKRVREVISLCLESEGGKTVSLELVGIQLVTV